MNRGIHMYNHNEHDADVSSQDDALSDDEDPISEDEDMNEHNDLLMEDPPIDHGHMPPQQNPYNNHPAHAAAQAQAAQQMHRNNHGHNMEMQPQRQAHPHGHHGHHINPHAQVQAPQAQPQPAIPAAAPELDNQPPLEGYERTDRIGQGAYGIVYRGIQRTTGSTVAIKRIPFSEPSPEGGVPCNVIREISLLRELNHPNVVQLLDVNQAQPGELYLVFEFVAQDLKTFVDRFQTSTELNERHGLRPDVVRNFMKQILEGVAFCHCHRIMHRDLKPHNLLISSDGTKLKLADFGLARLSGLPNGPYTTEVVTLWYRAPELLLGCERYDAPVDVWSIGCIFAEMATGYALFPGRSDIDQLFKIFQRRGTPSDDLWAGYSNCQYYNGEFPQWRQRHIREIANLSAFESCHAEDLLEDLLQYDPDRRLACKMALRHPFFFEAH